MHCLNKNKYPLDPSKETDPLEHLRKTNWNSYNLDTIKNEIDFENEWEMQNSLHETTRNKIVWIKNKTIPNKSNLIKIYKTHGHEQIFLKRYKEFIYVQETLLMEYYNFYYNRKTKEIYIEMPFYSDSLKQFIGKNGAMNNEKEVKLIAYDLLLKLWVIHNSGYVHCDIKPSNVIKREFNDEFKDNNNIKDGYKLIDFELMHRNNSTGKYVGTMGWSSPEITPDCNKNVYEYSSDIFSFGLLILYILFGKNPFEIPKQQRIVFINQMIMENDKITNKQIKRKYNQIWYDEIVSKSENKIKNYLVKLYYNDEISYDLFELLFEGLLVYDPNKRWNCKQIYNCKWFNDIKCQI